MSEHVISDLGNWFNTNEFNQPARWPVGPSMAERRAAEHTVILDMATARRYYVSHDKLEQAIAEDYRKRQYWEPGTLLVIVGRDVIEKVLVGAMPERWETFHARFAFRLYEVQFVGWASGVLVIPKP